MQITMLHSLFYSILLTAGTIRCLPLLPPVGLCSCSMFSCCIHSSPDKRMASPLLFGWNFLPQPLPGLHPSRRLISFQQPAKYTALGCCCRLPAGCHCHPALGAAQMLQPVSQPAAPPDGKRVCYALRAKATQGRTKPVLSCLELSHKVLVEFLVVTDNLVEFHALDVPWLIVWCLCCRG